MTTSEARRRYLVHLDNAVEILMMPRRLEIRSKHGGLFWVRTSAELSLIAELNSHVVVSQSVDDRILWIVQCPPGAYEL